MGAPSKYDDQMGERLIRYFHREPYGIGSDGKKKANDLPLFGKFASLNGVTMATLLRWTKTYPEFGEAYEQAKEIQRHILVTNSLHSLYNSAYAIFATKNLFEWTDKRELVEMKFIMDFTIRVGTILNNRLPDTCPNCKCELSLKNTIITEIEKLSKNLEFKEQPMQISV